MDKVILSIDAGGTSVKYALLSYDSLEHVTGEKFLSMPSRGTKQELLDTFAAIFRDALEQSERLSVRITLAAFSVPGPFDCERGISRMTHKWLALKDVPLREEFARMGILPSDMPCFFIHDVHGFLVGEKFCGEAARCRNVAAIIIGTGLGFGLWCEDTLLFNETGGVRYSIFKQACGDGILEDYVSGRGISAAYQRLTGEECSAKEVADRARQGDDRAKRVYSEMGAILGRGAARILREHAVDCVVIGGRVSCSYDLFGSRFAEEIHAAEYGITVYPSRMLEYAAMRGAAAWGKKQLEA